MNWSEIRSKYPDTLVLVEAVSVYSKGNKRMIQEMSVVDEYNSTESAWAAYKKIHRDFPQREFYIFHTRKEEIEVEEQRFSGVRGRA
ncbi:hypothetical protein CN425_20810 [Bacillus cereus]|uniref:Uncharacterized protein n=1 Tax=Bacillus cereus TaxID=1396 RepID=A0A2A9UAV4_BACCE|nr:hypothetical protein [Bacillus cereus]EJS73594.1 hypothetical protein ICU_00630 [Bacillus cereus BAG2X1-1]EJS78317.1 hypothetical protein ICY_00481 [Bacillus cereus BAG2X1-3]PEA10877.1 hypothetical protein CON38_03935 [Bacillus cereus]PEV98410.1 hypothetical protein CN425_20810 [Bacillus cereus]PFI17933.1 hypothetical protein COI75_19090 [Bacillus cereus]